MASGQIINQYQVLASWLDSIKQKNTKLFFSLLFHPSVRSSRVRVQCSANYYNTTCTTFCRPRNDQFGHYTCGDKGQKICLAGWQGANCEKGKTTLMRSRSKWTHWITLSRISYSDLQARMWSGAWKMRSPGWMRVSTDPIWILASIFLFSVGATSSRLWRISVVRRRKVRDWPTRDSKLTKCTMASCHSFLRHVMCMAWHPAWYSLCGKCSFVKLWMSDRETDAQCVDSKAIFVCLKMTVHRLEEDESKTKRENNDKEWDYEKNATRKKCHQYPFSESK